MEMPSSSHELWPSRGQRLGCVLLPGTDWSRPTALFPLFSPFINGRIGNANSGAASVEEFNNLLIRFPFADPAKQLLAVLRVFLKVPCVHWGRGTEAVTKCKVSY